MGARLAVDATDLHKQLEPLLKPRYDFVGDADASAVGGHDPRVDETEHRNIMRFVGVLDYEVACTTCMSSRSDMSCMHEVVRHDINQQSILPSSSMRARCAW